MAEWIIFHRLYVTRYNAFMDVCPAGFKHLLDELGIISCARKVHRRSMVAFEATEDIACGDKLSDRDFAILRIHRLHVARLLFKVAALYSDYQTNSLDPYEASILSNSLRIDVGRLVSVKYEQSAL